MMNLDSRKVHASSRPLDKFEKIALVGCAYYIALLVAGAVVYGFLAASQQIQAWWRGLSEVHVQWVANLPASQLPSLILASIILLGGWGIVKTNAHRRTLRYLRRG
jgi:hypothetical protein